MNVIIDCHVHKSGETLTSSVVERFTVRKTPLHPLLRGWTHRVLTSPLWYKSVICSAKGILHVCGGDRVSIPEEVRNCAVGEGFLVVHTVDNKCYVSSNPEFTAFTEVPLPKDIKVRLMYAGDKMMYILTESGQVYHWGTAECFGNVSVPTVVPCNVPIIEIAVAKSFVLFLGFNGFVFKCDLMTGASEQLPIRYIERIRAGHSHALLKSRAGKLYGFGSNDHGQLGFPSDVAWCFKPTQIPAFVDIPVKTMACGYDHSVVTTEGRKVYTFGRNNVRQLGLEDTVEFQEPVLLHKLTTLNARHIACSADTTYICVGDIKKRIISFGNNDHGQLGSPDCKDTCTHFLSPVELK